MKSSATVVSCLTSVDGSATGVASLIINGAPRMNTAAVTLDMGGSGPAPQLFDVYATVVGLTISSGFALQATLHGTTAPASSRKIAEVTWSGSAVTQIANMVNAVAGHGALHGYAAVDPIIGLGAQNFDPAYVDGTPAQASLRTLGTGAQEAAAGNDPRFGAAAAGNDPRFFSPGDLKISAVASPQTGWLLCDGTAYPVVGQTAILFAAIGYTFGGAGASFNVPDYRGRSIIGAGSGPGLTARTLGQRFGEENHALTDSELASHSHGGLTGVDNQSHNHGVVTFNTLGADNGDYIAAGTQWVHEAFQLDPGGGGQYIDVAAKYVATTYQPIGYTGITSPESAQHNHNIPTDGGGAGHNNIQPSATASVFIKL